jgi:hypothetical protein
MAGVGDRALPRPGRLGLPPRPAPHILDHSNILAKGRCVFDARGPIWHHATEEPAVFRPENLLAKAATMLGCEQGRLPPCCVLDFESGRNR